MKTKTRKQYTGAEHNTGDPLLKSPNYISISPEDIDLGNSEHLARLKESERDYKGYTEFIQQK